MCVKKYNIIEEEVYSYNINGLNVHIVPKPFYLKKSASLSVRFGSKNLSFSIDNGEYKIYPEGIAHFLEHKVFESDKGNSFEKFYELGARVNAFTNFNVTNYYFSTINNFENCLNELFDMVMNPYFTDENVEKEKGIIEQEIKMYEDDPFNKLYYTSLSGMYNSIPIYKDIAGTVESIYKITPAMLQENFDAFYRYDNMDLIIVGDINVDKILEQVKSIVKDDKNKKDVKKFKYIEKEQIEYREKAIELKLNMDRFLLTFKDISVKSKEEMIKRDVIMDFIKYKYFSKSSKLYQELYDEGLINENFQASYSLYEDYAFQIIYAESKNVELVKEKIFKQLCNKKDISIDDQELTRIKKILIGKFFESFNSVEGLSYEVQSYICRGIDFFKYYEYIIEMKKEDIVKNIERVFDINKSVFVYSK